MRNGLVTLPIAMPNQLVSAAGIDSGVTQRSYGIEPVDKSTVKIYNSGASNEWGYLLVIGC